MTTKARDRRWFLKLAAAAVFVVSGCTNARHESDLDAAMNELNQLLDNLDYSEKEQLIPIVQRIQTRARELADEHRTFIEHFDRLLITYDTTESQLQESIETYSKRRMRKRNDLLHLQDELHTAMTPDDWSRVVRVLNRAGKSLATYTLQSS